MALKNQITAIVIAGNEQDKIAKCIQALSWCQSVVLVAANSTDDTVKISKSINPNIVIKKTTDEYGKNFAKWRNIGLKATKTSWVLYIDSDEIVTKNLRDEVLVVTSDPNQTYTHFAIPRANHFLHTRVRHGGTYPDYVIRLYLKNSLKKWIGKLHETPKVEGQLAYLKNDLFHYTHNDLTSMLSKSIIWTQIEAQALYDNHHPPVYWWRFPRMIFTKLWQRLIVQSMYKDGIVGWISAIFESYNTFIIYARLWELQYHEKSRHL